MAITDLIICLSFQLREDQRDLRPEAWDLRGIPAKLHLADPGGPYERVTSTKA